jgi:hypothetical protein
LELQFYIRGVDYQPGGQSNLMDPLANPENCKRDIPLFKELGLNAIRICRLFWRGYGISKRGLIGDRHC